MSGEHQLAVGKYAMRRVYELFENHLSATYLEFLRELSLQGILYETLIDKVKHTSDPDQAFHILLDHLCEQDSENLQKVVEVLYHCGEKEDQPKHRLLAEKLEYYLNEFDKEDLVTDQVSVLAKDQTLYDSSNSDPSHLPSQSACKPDLSQATTKRSRDTVHGTESLEAWEYPELMSSLQYIFEGNLEEGEATQSTAPSNRQHQVGVHRDLNQKQEACASLYHGIPLLRFAGPLKGSTHGKLVILLWELTGSNATRSNLAYQLIRGKKQLPIDLQIINVLGAVYATSDNAHLFQEALEWTKRPDCLNPVYLQCRLNYLLSLCTLSSDKALSEQYLKQAYELSAMCEPDYTTALLMMQEARMTLSRIEEGRSQLSEEGLEQVSAISNRACEISRTLSEWMQPFAMVVRLLKMQLDARVALLLFKSGNHMGAIVVVMPLSMLVNEMEEPETFSQLLPRQQAVYHYIKTAVFVIHKNREAAMSSAVKGRDLFLKVNWFEPAHRIMEIVNDFN